ncbi:TetR/AcrR family transcriptional regulator [Cohnella zeiphila]|uniref:TetR/AcrR family transcriptional regulator n=1 Tax=Cohnella zeiphila TaxID=2761120 RepID=A0A7X0SJM3_9BACL|nr:TetR/AcrR family transcriptional regulator [Cohnella zeiphila]MBB6731210.1 TetR/AcrR family transcriptional regulator [Cohnella zeiphila]
MVAKSTGTSGGPGRPRSQEAWEAVMKAVDALLETQGYRRLTMEAIAKEAGVGKPTLYRWWPNAPSIVIEALLRKADDGIGLPDTGSLRNDLISYVTETCRILAGPTGEIVARLMAETQFDAEFADTFRQKFIYVRREALASLLRRGAERGEIPTNADLEWLADLCYGPIWYRLLNRHAELDDAFASRIVDLLLLGARTPAD